MDKKFYIYHLKNDGLSKLIKIYQSSIIEIIGNSTDLNCIIQLTPSGYFVQGKMSDQFKIYRDDANNIYYLCSNGHSDYSYFSINIDTTSEGYAISDYLDNFDISNLTEILPLKSSSALTKTQSQYTSISAGTVVEYISNSTYKQYITQSALIQISCRNSLDVGGSGLYFLHRKCADTKANTPVFSIEIIYADNIMSQFNITPTKDGFTFTNNASSFRYAITEISNTII